MAIIAAGWFGFVRISYYANEVAETLREQCASYDRLVVSDQTKSLFYLSDMMRQLSVLLDEGSSPDADESLKAFTDRTGLTGVVLLDRDLNIEAMACENELRKGTWNRGTFGFLFADIVKYPEKVYSERLHIDGEYYDFCAVAREDAQGILMGFYRQPTGLVTNTEDDLESLLTGLQLNLEGNYLIADADGVLAASDAYMDKASEKSIALCDAFVSLPDDKAVHYVQSEVGEHLACHAEVFGYSLYVYYPVHVIIVGTLVTTGAILLLYFVLVFGAFSIRNRALYENQIKLEYANNAKSEFLRRISHDIRTPVNGAIGYLDVAMAHPDDAEMQARCREKIATSLDTLMLLVNSVLNMSKLETSDIVIDHRPFSLNELLSHVGTVMIPQAIEKEITYKTSIADDVTIDGLLGSQRHVEQILLNLASNAVKYGKQGGYVEMGVKQLAAGDGRVTYEFTCTDNGIGMSEEFQQRMFELFAQENDSARSEYEGMGLGLSIVKKLVDALGGTVTCRSARGEGSCFTVVLSFDINPDVAQVQAAGQAQKAGSSLNGATVLMVEDNELNMEIAEFLLGEEGATVLKAWNGQEGVDAFAASDPGSIDLILMDIMMPVLDGYGAARAIRALDRPDASTVPIVAVSANAFSDDVRVGREAGMNAHIAKPVDIEKLLKTADKLLR